LQSTLKVKINILIGKEHAMAIGKMKMSSEEIKKINKGIAIEIIHFLQDSLF